MKLTYLTGIFLITLASASLRAAAEDLPPTIDIPIVVRDIHHSHPNFQIRGFGHVRGIVRKELGADGKPLWSPRAPSDRYNNLTSENDFNQWWSDTEGISKVIPGDAIIAGQAKGSRLTLTKNPDESYSFVSDAFFPIAKGNVTPGATLEPYRIQNFHFTVEIHNEFTYVPGQVFYFAGDDDVWVYIDGKLVVDLGGVHGPVSGSVKLDDLGLTEGETYPFDMFFAERHTTGSNFRMTLSMVLTPEPHVHEEREVVNESPVIAIGEDLISNLNYREVTLKPSVTDDGLPRSGGGLQIQWTQEAGPGLSKIYSPDKAETKVRFTNPGDYTLRCTATDGEFSRFEDLFIAVGESSIDTVETYGVADADYRSARHVWSLVQEELHCRNEGTLLEAYKRGFDPEPFHLAVDSEVIVTAIYDGGNARNTLGWYDSREPSTLRVIWTDFATGPEAPLSVGSRASLGVLPAGTQLRFYLQVDGARGGDDFLFQDAAYNPGGLEQIAARLFYDTDGERPLVMGFEDRSFQGDQDFNDVIFQIAILPKGLGDSQYHDVIPGKAGVYSDRGRRGVVRQLQRLELANGAYESTTEVYQLPEDGDSFEIRFLDDRSPMKFDLCVFDYDLVASLSPSSLAFRKTAAANAISLMDDRQFNPGQTASFTPAEHGLAGKRVGFFIVPNNRVDVYLRNPWRYTPKGNNNRTKRQPLFTINSANPGTLDQFFTFSDTEQTVFMIEDHTRYDDGIEPGASSNSSFDDISIQVTPALKPLDLSPSAYYLGSPDPTIGYLGPDGHAQAPRGENEDCCY